MFRASALISAVGLAIGLAVGPGCADANDASAAAPSPGANASSPQVCKKVMFFGVRASGEPANAAEQNMGETVFSTYQGFARRAQAAGLEVTPVGLGADEYPAVPALPEYGTAETLLSEILITQSAGSVLQGTAGLSSHIVPFLARDTSACFIAVGYSQGAWVIGD